MSDQERPDLRVVPVAPDGLAAPSDSTQADEDAFTPDPLNARENLLVDSIAAGESLADSATAAGISYRTARRWRLKPHLAEAIRNRVSENLAQTRAILSAGSSRAARGLVAMADPQGATEPNSARVSAARGVLESAMKLAELEDVIERLAKLEEQLANQPGQPGRTRGF
jgi:HD-like signal output (HDOD) protein